MERGDTVQRKPIWTAHLVGLMHLEGISQKELSKELGWGEKYLSAVLNGRRAPVDAEEKVSQAFARISIKKDRREAGLSEDLEELISIYRREDPEYASRLARYLGIMGG